MYDLGAGQRKPRTGMSDSFTAAVDEASGLASAGEISGVASVEEASGLASAGETASRLIAAKEPMAEVAMKSAMKRIETIALKKLRLRWFLMVIYSF